mmetsp:Transcript_27222/g.62769  ORF Transcript_27222/g.62769 Transcript_27222/m.62769 type:complete len:361 (+) Transcript_27222:71-1153(+)
MVDQKQLRELMKKEKEKRTTAKAPGGGAPKGRPVPGSSPGPSQPANSPNNAPPTAAEETAEAAAMPPPPLARKAGPPAVAAKQSDNSGLLMGAYDDDEEERVEPAAKKAKLDLEAMPPPPIKSMPPPPVRASATQAEKTAMPPPPAMSLQQKKLDMKKVQEIEAEIAAEEAEARILGPLHSGSSSSSTSAQRALVGTNLAEGDSAVKLSADTLMQTADEEADAPEEKPQGLPEGFFDDPDADAWARGAEAPSERAERELEEGFKKFEKEMIIENELSEEARHRLDELRYEKIAAEEAAFQQSLQQKLDDLKLQAVDRMNRGSSQDDESSATAEDYTAEADALEDSGSDIEFDWRAKGFGV